MRDLEYDFKELAICSEMAQDALLEKKEWELVNLYEDLEMDGEEGCYFGKKENIEFSFHPNGMSGCLNIDDDYRFGIRCNHLIWVEGWCEGYEEWWRKEEQKFNAILLMGNHKGHFMMKLVAIHNNNNEN